MSDSKKDKKKQKKAQQESDMRWRTGMLNKDERKAMERYGLDANDYSFGGQSWRNQGKDDYDQMREDFLRAASNDYDTRRGIEALAMSGKEKAIDLAKNGFTNPGDVMNANNMQAKQHKRMGNGGDFSSRSDFAGVSFGSVERDRRKFTEANDAKYASNSAFDDFEQQQQAPAAPVKDSKELAEAKERVQNWEQSNSGYSGDPTPYGGGGESMFSDGARAVYRQSSIAEAAQGTTSEASNPGSYLEAFKAGLKQKKNFEPEL